eukprot:CAMPEP_0177661014 /NCGR_PEP_ID=MMETSP0447-20121125/18401_1 /TAXON_ID=0 /ORGANISM="Stygamoeba regulata, Strain BSH-02190019" /LENGTH=158 /DNA_ID=CAMNT_0019166225 /DNA_START=136 /DNA_END=610 /DNA_ORIENTATION=+
MQTSGGTVFPELCGDGGKSLRGVEEAVEGQHAAVMQAHLHAPAQAPPNFVYTFNVPKGDGHGRTHVLSHGEEVEGGELNVILKQGHAANVASESVHVNVSTATWELCVGPVPRASILTLFRRRAAADAMSSMHLSRCWYTVHKVSDVSFRRTRMQRLI